jgi:dienelactone hydrolase
MVRWSLALSLAFGAATAVAADVVMETPPDLPGFTVYRPEHVASRLPIVAWGNGGCVNLGNSAEALLRQIASHGYLVVAIGPVGAVPDRSTRPARSGTPEEQLRAAVATSGPAPTHYEQLIEGIDWAIAANRAGALAGKIETQRIAVAGHSCGGLQAIAASSDTRIDTTVILNSGVFEQPRVKVDKAALARLHAPIVYFMGGPSDMAYANAEDDYRHIAHVPVLKANNTFGHGGRLKETGGGPTGGWVTRWLDWQLKDAAEARTSFVGANCDLCREPGWSVEGKGFATE